MECSSQQMCIIINEPLATFIAREVLCTCYMGACYFLLEVR